MRKLSRWNITIFDNIKSRRGTQIALKKADLGGYLLRVQAAQAKDQITLWSPATFDGTRSKANARDVCCLVFDLDSGVPFTAWRCFAAKGLWTLAYTTWSHSATHHKWRLVLPLSRAVPAADWPKAYRAALEGWTRCTGLSDGPDKACRDASRIYYAPASPTPDHTDIGMFDGPAVKDPICPGNLLRAIEHKGRPLRLTYDHIKDAPPPPPVRLPPFKNADRQARAEARTDASLRLTVAQNRGAVIDSGTARKMICPACSRPDLWFVIDPATGGDHWARCNHQKSCGYYADVYELTK